MTQELVKKRKQVKNACVNCQKACKKCDISRPCPRCIRYGLEETCVDSVRKERRKGVKRGPYKRKAKSDDEESSIVSSMTPHLPMLDDHMFSDTYSEPPMLHFSSLSDIEVPSDYSDDPSSHQKLNVLAELCTAVLDSGSNDRTYECLSSAIHVLSEPIVKQEYFSVKQESSVNPSIAFALED